MEKVLQKIILLSMTAHNNETYSSKLTKLMEELFACDKVNFLKEKEVNDARRDNNFYLPIVIDNKLLGYYEIVNPRNIDVENLNFLSQILTLMHENLIAQEMKNILMNTDRNTNVYNKNYFLDYCKHFDPKKVKSIGCVFLDVNGLRVINNTYGHNYGDMVISKVAQILKSTFDNVLCFRFGGDEFVILCLDMAREDIEIKVENLKQALDENDIYVSTGIAYQSDNINMDILIHEADKQMYIDKANFYNHTIHDRRKS